MAHIFTTALAFSKDNDTKDLSEAMMAYAKEYLNERHGKPAFTAHSKEEMESLINKSFAKAVATKSKVTLDENATKTDIMNYSKNPQVMYFASLIRDTLIDEVLPVTLSDGNLRLIADIKYADLGDSLKFDIKNNQLFTVSRIDYRRRKDNIQKDVDTTVTMNGVNHAISISTTLFDILTGNDNIAADVMKANISIETAMFFDAFDAFSKSMNALSGVLNVANYSEKSLVTLAQTVTAYNQGRKAVVLGTPVALQSVLPTNSNYRYDLMSDFVKLGHLPTIDGYDVIPLEQVANPYADDDYALKLDDSKIYVVSPAADKIVKVGVFGGTVMGRIDANSTANTTEVETVKKAWDVATITNSVAGIITNLG